MKLQKQLRDFILAENQDENDCLLYMLACKYGLKYRAKEETFQFLVKHNLIKLDFATNKIILLTGLFEGELVELPEYDMSVETVIKERVEEYRKMFHGIRSGSIGQKQKVIENLTRFCIENQKTFDEVLSVTKVYMTYAEFKLISNADNFIYKIDRDGNEISLLKLAFEEQSMSEDTFGDRTWKMI